MQKSTLNRIWKISAYESWQLISKRELSISNEVKSVAKLIISKTNQFDWTTFISLVYSTYPVKTSSKYTKLNLVQDAIEYKKIMNKWKKKAKICT